MGKDALMLSPNLQDFQQMYQKHASGLLEPPSNLVPPGHPLYTRNSAVNVLKLENDKLAKENLELKKQLDDNNNDNAPKIR